MQDVTAYLRQHEPFAALDPAAVRRLAGEVEIEYFAGGSMILEQDQDPPDRVGMVVSGAVELLDRGRTLDLLGPGEMFGHPSMLSGLPTGFAVRAVEDTLCYRLPSDLVLDAFSSREGLRYVARSLLARPGRLGLGGRDELDLARRPVSALISEPLVMSAPGQTIRDVAVRMAETGASCAVIKLADDALGILTDQDLRVRVVGGEVPMDAPVLRAMTAPAFTVSAEALGADVTVEMINRGVRHVPVLSTRRRVLGVVSDVDLLAADTRAPFTVRRGIERARDVEELIAAADDLRPVIVALHDAQIAAPQLCATIAAFADALTRRALQLLGDDPRLPPLAWMATGSIGRSEAFPSSDLDTVLSWDGDDDRTTMTGFAGEVLGVLARCGFGADDHAASAAHPLFARPVAGWRGAIDRWLDRPEDERLTIVVSILADARLVHETGPVPDAFGALAQGPRHPRFMAQMRRLALSHRPPTGFMRDFVVAASGEQRGRLDIKRGGFLPIVDLARYLALVTGSTAVATTDRLRDAEAAGAISAEDRSTLDQAFALCIDLRMGHQIEQLRRGETPTDFIDPAQLNPLVRRYLREAFRAIARSQRGLAGPVMR